MHITYKGSYKGDDEVSFSIVPANVTNLTLTSTEDSITAKWDAVPGADGYKVYLYEDEYYEGKDYDGRYDETATEISFSWLDSDSYYRIEVKAYMTDYHDGDCNVYSAEGTFAEIDTLPDPDSDWDEEEDW